MKYHTITLNEEEVNFRLVSIDSLEIEKKTNTPLQQYIQSISNTNCINLLKYMRKSSIPNFSEKDANELYDLLVDDGYSLESIYMDIIYPACVVSGVLTQEDYDKIKQAVLDAKNGVNEDTVPPQNTK